jgi:hypothetical protein
MVNQDIAKIKHVGYNEKKPTILMRNNGKKRKIQIFLRN